MNYIDGKPFVIRHIRDKNCPFGGSSIGVKIDADNKELEVSLTTCRGDERFTRKLAQQVLEERMNIGQTFKIKGWNREFSLVHNVVMALARNYERAMPMSSTLSDLADEVGSSLSDTQKLTEFNNLHKILNNLDFDYSMDYIGLVPEFV